MLGTQPFVLCREVVLFRRLFVYRSELLIVLFQSVLYRRFHFTINQEYIKIKQRKDKAEECTTPYYC